MKLSTDSRSYLEQQEVFTGEMIARIADHLDEAGIQDEVLKDLTGKVAFEVASMIDGISEVSFKGSEAHPYLTFQKGEDEIIHLGGNSYTHELVFGILDAMFSNNTEQKIARTKRLVAAARSVFSGETGISTGADIIHNKLCRLGEDWINRYDIFEKYVTLPTIVPSGSLRLLWNPDRVLDVDAKLAKRELKYRRKIMEACVEIIKNHSQ
jgi:hypothetical protein